MNNDETPLLHTCFLGSREMHCTQTITYPDLFTNTAFEIRVHVL